MNRKQKRDLLKSRRGEGGDFRTARKVLFGSFGRGLTNHFNSKNKEQA
jgi:hypothetical protein